MVEDSSFPLTGRKVGDYRILAPLGRGGMGLVYAAEDTRLRRKVAIKFLAADSVGDERRKQRLFHEARAAAALDHPNICSIYDVAEAEGQPFIVMQYVEGQTLDARRAAGPMDVGEILDVAAQVAEALVEAHERGIVHRDVKPQNIMLSARGQVKVLDFGIATIAPKVDEEALTASGLRTLEGAVAGTIPYMSPEQIRNEALDGRSDVFSFGIVLHEIATGTHPFRVGTGAPDTLAAILTKNPPPFDPHPRGTLPELERIVRKCLEKDRALRYQSARELLADLRRMERDSSEAAIPPPSRVPARRWATRRYALAAVGVIVVGTAAAEVTRRSLGTSVISSVAVLPLVSVNVASTLEYQTEGITDSLIDTLSRLPGLKVMSRSAVSRYQGRQIDLQQAGRELGVDALLTGSIAGRGEGDALTLRLELVDADDSSYIWGKQYDLTPANLLAVQREIRAEVSEKLRPRLASATVARTGRDTDDPEAYRLYTLGNYSLLKFRQEASREAIGYFQKAIDRDPAFALAYSGLAAAYIFGAGPGIASKDALRLGRAAALKALELDPDLGDAHAALAGILFNDDWDFAGAEREYRLAIELNPNNVGARHAYSHFLLRVGRPDEALAEARKVEELDPVSPLALGHFAYYYVVTSQFDEAIRAYERYIKDADDPGSFLQYGDAYYMKGMFDQAVEQYLRGHEENGVASEEIAAARKAYVERGIKGYLQTRIAQLETRGQPEPNRTPMTSLGGQLASLHALLGDKDRAFQLLERMYAERDDAFTSIREEITFDSLRSDRRFADLLRRIGLPPF